LNAFLIERLHGEVRDPVHVIEAFEDYRTGERDLPPDFLHGVEGICRSVLIVVHVCVVLGVEVHEMDGGDVDEMCLGPIIDRFGDIETLFFLFRDIVDA
jgi:hypothetical protein